MLTRSAVAISAMCFSTVAACAEMVTTGDLSVVCGSHYAVIDAINAIANAPDNIQGKDLIEPLGCVLADGGFTFVPTETLPYAGVWSGIIIGSHGKGTPAYVNEGGLRKK